MGYSPLFLLLHTDWEGIELYRSGEDFTAWTPDDSGRPRSADIPICIHEEKIHERKEDGSFVIIGKCM